MSNYTDVKTFMTVFGQNVPNEVIVPDLGILKLRMKLIIEEVQEFYEAILANNISSGYGPIPDIFFGFNMINKGIESLTEQDIDVDIVAAADAMTDINYINEGSGVAFGIDLDKCFAEVQRSNMSKLDANGNPICREDGKILKSELYSPPDLTKVLKEQGWS